jgi:hypothetical protein
MFRQLDTALLQLPTRHRFPPLKASSIGPEEFLEAYIRSNTLFTR